MSRVDEAGKSETGRYPVEPCASAEAHTASCMQAKAEASGLMEAVVERGNLKLAYQRVVQNKGTAGVDELTVFALKDHLKQHWPAIRAKLLAGAYVPSPVRRADIAKPDGGQRMLGIPTVVDRLIQQALHQVLSPILSSLTSRRQATAFGREEMRIKQCSRPGSTWPAASAGWSIWTWRSSSTGSITIA